MNDTLPPLNPLGAKSFWYAFAAVLIILLNRVGIYPAQFLGLAPGDARALVDLLWDLLLPMMLVGKAMHERRAPQRRLTFTGPLT